MNANRWTSAKSDVSLSGWTTRITPEIEPILIVSHPRSGTHLTIDFLRKQFAKCQILKKWHEPYHRLYLSVEGLLDQNEQRRLTETAAVSLVSRCLRPVIKSHAYSLPALEIKFPQWISWISVRGKTVYVVRDYRSVVLSLYYYVRMFNPQKTSTISDFIRQPFIKQASRPKFWNEEVKYWYERDDVLFLRYEDLISDPSGTLKQLEDYLAMPAMWRKPLLPSKPGSIVQMRMRRFLSRNPESTAILSSADVRSSKNLQKNQLSFEDMEFIEQEAGEMLHALGYL